MIVRIFVLALMSGLLLSSCDNGINDKATLRISLDPVVGGLPLAIGQTYADANQRGFRIDAFRMYLSDVALIDQGGDTIPLTETIFLNLLAPLTVYDEIDSSLTATFEIDPGDYKGIIFGTGVPANRNNGDPVVYDRAHPLAITWSMNWSWASGYRFVSIDGYADTTDNQQGPPTQGLTYHTGFNELYRTVDMTGDEASFSADKGETIDFNIQLEVLNLFTDGNKVMKLDEEFTTPHSLGNVDSLRYATSVFMMDNLANRALTKVPF